MSAVILRRGLPVFLCLLAGFALPRAAAAESPTARALVQQANERWETLSDFQSGLEIKLQFFGTPFTILGRGWLRARH